LLSLFS
jgi:hypothetical protein